MIPGTHWIRACVSLRTGLRKSKQSSPATYHGGAWGERRYSSYSFLTSALNGGEWSASRPGRFSPGKGPQIPIVQGAGWASEAGLDTEVRGKILWPCRRSNPNRPAGLNTHYNSRDLYSISLSLKRGLHRAVHLCDRHVLKYNMICLS
jgi:hypothetical protein